MFQILKSKKTLAIPYINISTCGLSSVIQIAIDAIIWDFTFSITKIVWKKI